MKEETIITPELKVSNFHKSLDFYTKILGFKILYDRPENEFAMVEKNSGRLMIEGFSVDENKNRNWLTSNLEFPFGRGINFQIMIKDIEVLYKKILEKSYPIFFEIEEKWYRKNNVEVGQKQFLIQDPDGYLLRFAQDIGEREIK